MRLKQVAILLGQAWPWLCRAILMPGLGALVVLLVGAAVMPELSRLPLLIWIGVNGALALAAALLSAPATRDRADVHPAATE